jgi:hypothetical protein
MEKAANCHITCNVKLIINIIQTLQKGKLKSLLLTKNFR